MSTSTPMPAAKRLLFALNLVIGPAVLGSYVLGYKMGGSDAALFWGGVPLSWQPVYTFNMFLAAGGYLVFTGFFAFSVDPADTKVFGRWGFGSLNLMYLGVLLFSAIWMPLTALVVNAGNGAMIIWIIVDLTIVALSSLALLLTLWTWPEPSRWLWAARIGAVFFCLQTVVLDGIVWTTLFRI